MPTSLLFAGGLADNGGPTQTIALRDAPDNPALAGADPADAPATDQRGEARPQPAGTDPDIGAFELNPKTAVPLNEIVGTPRGEFLSGTAGADLMRGLGGDDRLWGRPGDDVLFGDAGKDVLAGKAGIDQMTGGDGADRFLFRRVGDAPAAGPSYDEILDFSRAQHDKIDLRPIDANRAVGGNQAFHFVGDEAFTHAGQLRYEATPDGDFLVSGNTDRDLDADFAFVVRTGAEQLKAATSCCRSAGQGALAEHDVEPRTHDQRRAGEHARARHVAPDEQAEEHGHGDAGVARWRRRRARRCAARSRSWCSRRRPPGRRARTGRHRTSGAGPSRRREPWPSPRP